MIFSRLNQLTSNVTSRKDDLVSLCYILVFLLNRGKLLDIDMSDTIGQRKAYKLILKSKIN